ncbi:MAG: ABC transporter permease [Jatrophihabitantaceae bacterium]
MFLVTSVAMLRERTSGTLERLFTTRLAKLDLLIGYAIAFAVASVVQIGVASLIAFGRLGLDSPAGIRWVLVLALASALLGMALGLLSYAVEGMTRVRMGVADGVLVRDVLVVVGCILAALALGAATLRRRTS